jgi:hypothetical protein
MFHGAQSSITMISITLHWALSWARWTQSIPPHPISLQQIFNIVPRWWYLLELHNTPLCLWHCFICNSASHYYNLSLHWVQTPWCLVSGRSFDVLSSRRLADNFMSSLLGGQRITDWLLIETYNLSWLFTHDWRNNTPLLWKPLLCSYIA